VRTKYSWKILFARVVLSQSAAYTGWRVYNCWRLLPWT